MELKRYRHLDRLESLLTRYPVVAILSSALVRKYQQAANEGPQGYSAQHVGARAAERCLRKATEMVSSIADVLERA
jgi:hypothetical protein